MPSFDPKNHTIVFGTIKIPGEDLGTDEFFNLSPESDAWEDEVGVGGHVQRNKINDERATVTITAMKTARVNDALSAYYNLDRATPGGLGAVPFVMRDRSGTTVVTAAESWLMRLPDNVRGRQAGTTQWQIRLAKVKAFYGGNS